MILSHRHKFIFIKTNKTAGTSIEIALSKHCGPDDVVTEISLEDEHARRELGHVGPQNHRTPISNYSISDWFDRLRGRGAKVAYYNHMSAREIIALVGRDVWDNYYKFCFERNPWERVISLYFWRHKNEPRPPISEFVRSSVPLILKERGSGLYMIDGEIVVDRVCRFENLADELETVRRRVGISEPLQLPRAKGQYRKDRRSWREILNDDERGVVADMFRFEIDRFEYSET